MIRQAQADQLALLEQQQVEAMRSGGERAVPELSSSSFWLLVLPCSPQVYCASGQMFVEAQVINIGSLPSKVKISEL